MFNFIDFFIGIIIGVINSCIVIYFTGGFKGLINKRSIVYFGIVMCSNIIVTTIIVFIRG